MQRIPALHNSMKLFQRCFWPWAWPWHHFMWNYIICPHEVHSFFLHICIFLNLKIHWSIFWSMKEHISQIIKFLKFTLECLVCWQHIWQRINLCNCHFRVKILFVLISFISDLKAYILYKPYWYINSLNYLFLSRNVSKHS